MKKAALLTVGLISGTCALAALAILGVVILAAHEEAQEALEEY